MNRKTTLHTIACYELALGAERQIPSLRGYVAYYCKSLGREELLMIQQYQKIRGEVALGVAESMEAEMRAKGIEPRSVPTMPPSEIPPPKK